VIHHDFRLLTYERIRMFINNVIYLNDTVSPTLRQQFTGTFHGSDRWGDGDLELHLSEAGVLTGYFAVEDIKFELKGCVGHTGNAFGFLLEPDHAIPVALLRINIYDDGLSLESYVPEFTELFSQAESEKVSFRRGVKATTPQELLVIGA
jgi:hypothetical protein